jgi:hypothetical protein
MAEAAVRKNLMHQSVPRITLRSAGTATTRLMRAATACIAEAFVPKPASPMEQLDRDFRRQRTGNKLLAMEKSLAALLSREGYSPGFRQEALALQSGPKTDLLFEAAFTLLTDSDSRHGAVRIYHDQVLDAIRLMHDILPKVSRGEIRSHVQSAPQAISSGTDKKKDRAAVLLARMCGELGIGAREAVWWEVYCEVSALKNSHPDLATRAAATRFVQLVEQRPIDIGRDLKSVA